MTRPVGLMMAAAVMLVLLGTSVAWAGPEEFIVYFSVSLVQPKTGRRIPIKIYSHGRFTYDPKMRIPHGATLFVSVRVGGGRYLSAVFRDDADQQFDLPRAARRLDGNTKEFLWTMPRRFVAGRVELFLCLWANLNPQNNRMEGAVERTGWVRLGETSL